MGAFIIAGIIFFITLLICILAIFANGMSDAPSQSGISVWPAFIGGTLLSAIVLASHWLTHIGW